MAEDIKLITNDESLKLLGLFKLATEYYSRLREAEVAINRSLGKDADNQGHISDAIYGNEHSTEDFYKALKLDGVEVADRERE